MACNHVVKCAVTKEERAWALQCLRDGRPSQVAMAGMALKAPCLAKKSTSKAGASTQSVAAGISRSHHH